MEDTVRRGFRETVRVLEAFQARYAGEMVEVARIIAGSLGEGGKLLAFGNGGSAAEAQHLAGELVNRFRLERPPLAGLALTTDTSALTAIGNDVGFDRIFEQQLLALASPRDVAVGFSTSGTSLNVIRGLRAARRMGCVCVGLTGEGGGELPDLCDHLFPVPSRETPRIQECHTAWVHAVCGLVEEILFPELVR